MQWDPVFIIPGFFILVHVLPDIYRNLYDIYIRVEVIRNGEMRWNDAAMSIGLTGVALWGPPLSPVEPSRGTS